MSRKLPLVSIVTVNYNGKQYLRDCIKSFEKLDYPKNKLEIIMVDNCSTDGSLGFVQAHFPEVTILKNDVNNYARANNLGIKHSKGAFVALVNNDVRLDKAWLRKLMGVMRSDARVGIAGGKLLFKDRRIQSTGLEEYPEYYWGDRGFKLDDKGQFENIEEMPSLCGAALLARRECFADAGFFDEDFVMYLEDVDMCFRCAKKGWKILYIPDAVAYHYFCGTGNADLVRYFSERNRLLVLAKHFPEKLADMLYGKGYFSEEPHDKRQSSMYDVFPAIITKLFAYHAREYIDKLLPDIFKSLKHIVNLEKSILSDKCTQLSQLNTSLNKQKEELTQDLNAKESLLAQQQAYLTELNKQIEQLTQDLNAKESLLAQQQAYLTELSQLNTSLNKQKEELTQDLNAKESLLVQQQASLQELALERDTKNTQLQKLKYELTLLKSDFDSIIKLEKKITILIIKPQRISMENTELVLKALRQKYPYASLHLFANLTPQDYDTFSKNKYISTMYQPEKNKLSLMATIKFIFIFWLKRFDTVLVLSSHDQSSDYQGYKKAKLLALLSVAKTRHTYYVD